MPNYTRKIDLRQLAKLGSEVTKDNKDEKLAAIGSDIKDIFDSYFSQAQAIFAELPLERNDSGKISGKRLVLEQIVPNPELLGMYYTMTYSRSKFIKPKQTDPSAAPYCSLVPLILAAFRKFRGIQYSEWDSDELHTVVEKNLALSMVADMPELEVSDLLDLREASLRDKPATGWNIRVPASSVYHGKPQFAIIMKLQTWCAHPSIRHKEMVLDPKNWDEMPEPLVEEYVKPKEPEKVRRVAKPVLEPQELIPPWEL